MSNSIALKKNVKTSVNYQLHDDYQPELGFVCRSMILASMPHSKVTGEVFTRSTKDFTLKIVGNELAGGVPYGSYPRLILSWVASEVVKTKDREIILGQSLSDFMKKLGLSVTGGRWGTVSRFKQQLKMVFSSSFSVTCLNKELQYYQFKESGIRITDSADIYWDPVNPEQINLFKSKVVLSERFFEEITNTPIPIDVNAINLLKKSSLALDIYFWLTYRMFNIRKDTNISFEQLFLQFGPGYQNSKHGRYEFKRQFITQLKKVLEIYNEAKVYENNKGITLSPSPTHIKQLQLI